MSILIISDTHLTNQFDEPFCVRLLKRMAQHDQVILNGDFWDGYCVSFKQFVNSPWSRLFDVLMAKRAVYIFGNHDQPWMMNEGVHRFSTQQGASYVVSIGGTTYEIEHGHRLFDTWVTRTASYLPYTVSLRAYQVFSLLKRQHTPLGSWLTSRAYDLDVYGDSVVSELLAKRQPELNQWYVLGHTHIARKDAKMHYLNSGRCTREQPSCAVLHDNGTATLELL